MTLQVPDTLTFNSRVYEVLAWHDNVESIPSNKKLGISTVSPSTSNHSGRVDHFCVWDGKLYLFKIEATLKDPENTPLPKNARREKLFRYEQMYNFDGSPATCREYRYDYFVYENLTIPYSGSITIQNIIDEGWNKPESASENFEDESILLIFDNGILVD